MTANEGVGKKIVEALKKQTDSEFDLTKDLVEIKEENDDNANNSIEEKVPLETLFGETSTNNAEITDSDKFEIKEQTQPSFQNSYTQETLSEFESNAQNATNQQQLGWNFEQPKQEFQPTFTVTQPDIIDTAKARQFDMPPNVAVLKRLIAQLPAGVAKQTGAQIIKQTMEALGISMNTVLHEAQKVQDDMNESIKNCMVSIQEYKNNIKNLEKQGLDYQRQVNQLNDLISLFILSDNE